MTTIAVDAMGGDHAPKAEVEGAIRAAGSLNVSVLLVGQQDALRKELALHPAAADLPIKIHHASEVVTMEDSAAKSFRGEEGFLDSRGMPAAARRRSRRGGFRGQYRRVHGDGEDGAGDDPRGGSSGAGLGVSDREGRAGGGDRRGRECRFVAGDAGAVRHHGRNVLAHYFSQSRIRAWDCCRSARKSTRATI